MDYHGIAEVEILRDRANGTNYVIEINPRPWIQYGLAEASGRDLLAFQLAPVAARGRVVTSGKRWMNLPADLYYCFSRSAGVVRSGEITCSVRIWMRPHVKVGNRYPLGEGQIEVDSVLPIGFADITPELARESGFKGVVDLLKVAKHGGGENVYLVRFHYVAPKSRRKR